MDAVNAAKARLIEQPDEFVASQEPVSGKMLDRKAHHRGDCPIPHVLGVRTKATEATTTLENPVDAGQHGLLVKHMLESADADCQIDRLGSDSSQFLGVVNLEREARFPR
jgi:hypothetical protein